MSAPSFPENRLAKEPSPYLRQHKNNPVDWYPWGEEALEKARREDKPILLSIGYSACHWCHVMAHESFENPDIARRMNAWYVNVKVDREERPDLDQLYQGVVQLLGRGGGWPLTVFLTPDLRPFFGGTYFPPYDKFGMPGFPKLLEALHEAWEHQRDQVVEQAKQLESGLQWLAQYGLDASPADLLPTDVVRAANRLEADVDRRYGGFGGAPKFPNPMNVALLLRGWRRSGNEALRSAALLTLERMARGGIYDQLGGGFHRYSVDERWLVPHFEKMLYDNAQLLHLYAEAHQVEPRPLWKKVVEETVEYVRREMTAPQGGFFSAQDADSEGEEGKFFLWRPAEVRQLLSPPDATLVLEHFGITEQGNFEHGASVLEVVRTADELAQRTGRPLAEVEERLSRARRAMFEARSRRVMPQRDDKQLSGWNGLMIRGLSFAARVFDRPDWALLAAKAADFVLGAMWKDGRLFRSYQLGPRIDGFIEDYGDLAAGLCALYQATFKPKYLEAAERIADRALELFWDESKSAYLTAPKGQKDLFVPTYALHDSAFPSGASSLTEAQVLLAALTGRVRHLEQAERYLRRTRDEAVRNPFGYGHLLLAADAWLDGAAQLSIVGGGAEPLLRAANETYAPTVALAWWDGEVPEVLREAASGRKPLDGRAAAYLCRHFACQVPVTEPAELKRALQTVAA